MKSGCPNKTFMLNKIWKILLAVFIFLLPWQTRWIYSPGSLNGTYWEYGTASWYATEIVLWLTIICFALENFSRKKISHMFSKVHFYLHWKNLVIALGFIFFLAAFTVHSINIAVSYDYVFHIMEGVCLFVVLASVVDKRYLLYSFWWSAVLQGVLAIFQFFTQNISANKWLGVAEQTPSTLGSFVVETGTERWLRAYGSFGSPNILGGFLAAALILGLILYVQSRPVQKIYLTFGQSLILVGLIFSFSRGAWLAAVVGWVSVGLFLLLKNKRSKNFHEMGVYGKQSVFFFIIFVSTLILFRPLFLVRFDPSYRLENRSLTERAEQYLEATNVIQKSPFFGVGPGAYTLALYEMDKTRPAYVYQPVHNSFALIVSEWGIVGFFVWLIVISFLLSQIRLRNPEFLPVIITILISASLDHFWWSLYSGIIVWWAIFGLVFL